MTPEALDSLCKQELIALVLAQMEQIRLLTARVEELEARLNYLHTRHMVSYNRLVEMFKRLIGLEISEGAIANIFSRASAPFAADAERIDAEVRASGSREP